MIGTMVLVLALGPCPQEGQKPVQEVGRECVFEGSSKSAFATSTTRVPIKMTQIVLGEGEDGTRELARVVVGTLGDDSIEAKVNFFSVSRARDSKPAVMRTLSFATKLAAIPDVLEAPLDLEQIEQGDPVAITGRLNSWFGYEPRPLRCTIEDLGGERSRVHC